MSKQTFNSVPVQVDFSDIEENILNRWKEENIYKKVQDLRAKSGKVFTWLEGPPTANGIPHAGHALTRTLKDIMLRYQTMKGNWVRPRIGGWDCHGLPVEIEVEKQLGFTDKNDIIEYGIKDFNRLCRESVLKYEKEWVDMSERIGFWLDLDHPYITMNDNYIESVWWSLKTLHEKGFLYKGLRVAPLCTRCGTTLSSHELALGYKEVEDPAIFVKFRALEMDFDYYLAWTTTPWTLISNVMITVNADFTYAVVEHEGEKILLAKELIEKVFGEKKPIINEYKGKDLEYKKYEPIVPYFSSVDGDNAFIVTLADYVTLESGSGIVHSAPAFGADDADTGRRYKAPIVNAVDLDGKFTDEVTDFAKMWVKDADKEIIRKLKTEGKLLKREQYLHNYPHCWRCDTPLLYYGTESWFIAMSDLRDNLVQNNNQIHWQPEYLKQGRFGNFLENVVDWNLSRSRFWGTPLPVWICDGCDHTEILGSKQEIIDRIGDLPEDFELHRPWVDEIQWDCEKCEGLMIREPYVIDVWYDSGSAPFAQYHYPFENKEEFERDFPFNWITEAIDQTRGWFYTLLAVSTALFDKPSYTSVLCMNHILDANGQKMSKSKGNTIQTKDLFEKVGADATRWYLSSSQAWMQTRFGIQLVEEAQRKMMNTLWNVYSFFVTNANVDNYEPKDFSEVTSRPEIDRWILSRLQGIVKLTAESIEEMSFHTAVRALNNFIMEELSNWYVRRSRRRFYSDDMTEDKKHAYDTLYEVLSTLTKVLAPFTPFLAEEIYLNLCSSFSDVEVNTVHAEMFPDFDINLINPDLEEKMGLALDIANAGRGARAKANIKMRQPLQKLIATNPKEDVDLGDLIGVLAGEINVKELEILPPEKTLADYKIQPNLKILAPKVKGAIRGIKAHLEDLSTSASRDLVTRMQNAGKVQLEIEGKIWEFNEEEINVHLQSPDGYQMGQAGLVDVFLTTEITSELKQEGLAREVVRRIQEMRKTAELAFTDRIEVQLITEDKELEKAFTTHSLYISTETQADSLTAELSESSHSQDWEIEDMKLTLRIQKV